MIFKEYSALASESSTFEFEIQCPTLATSSNLDTAIEAQSVYDVASGTTLSLTTPVVTVNPVNCFSVTSFDVTDASSLNVPAYLSTSVSTIDIFTDDRSFLGSHTLLIKAVVSNGETIEPHNFDLEFEDTCRLTLLSETEPIESIEITAL